MQKSITYYHFNITLAFCYKVNIMTKYLKFFIVKMRVSMICAILSMCYYDIPSTNLLAVLQISFQLVTSMNRRFNDMDMMRQGLKIFKSCMKSKKNHNHTCRENQKHTPSNLIYFKVFFRRAEISKGNTILLSSSQLIPLDYC